MKILKEIENIEWNKSPADIDGSTYIEISEPIVMASAAGWYVGKICKEDGFVQPYDRFTDYFATPEEAQIVLNTPIDQGGFNEDFGLVQREFG